jgi:hypothetical protein
MATVRAEYTSSKDTRLKLLADVVIVYEALVQFASLHAALWSRESVW